MNFRPKKRIEKARVQRILIRATNWVGDAIMTLPALEAVRENFPGRDITVLAKPWVAPLFENHPAVDHVLVFDKGHGPKAGLTEILRVARLIRKARFDLAILLQNAFEAALLPFWAGSSTVWAIKPTGGGFCSPMGCREAKRCFQFIRWDTMVRFSVSWGGLPGIKIRCFIRAVRRGAEAAEILRGGGIDPGDFIVGLSPGAVFGGAKRWPPDRFARIGDRAIEDWDARVVVFGSGGEKEIGDRVCEGHEA